jgi:hypothetical protein
MKELSCYGGNGKVLLEDNPLARKCPTCGRFTHPWEDFGDIKTRTIYHFNITADRVPMVSSAFKVMLDEFGVENVDYFPLSSGFFVVRPRRSIFLDLSDCEMRIGEYCQTCCRPKSVLGKSWRARTLEGERPVGPRELVRGEQELGGGPNFITSFYVGSELAAHIKAQKLPKVYVWDIPRRVFPDEPPLKK